MTNNITSTVSSTVSPTGVINNPYFEKLGLNNMAVAIGNNAKTVVEEYASLNTKVIAQKLGEGIHEGCKIVAVRNGGKKTDKWYTGFFVTFQKGDKVLDKWIGLADSADITSVPFKRDPKTGAKSDFVWETAKKVITQIFGNPYANVFTVQSLSAALASNSDIFADMVKNCEFTLQLGYPRNKPYIKRVPQDDGSYIYRVHNRVPEDKNSKVYTDRVYKTVEITGAAGKTITGDTYATCMENLKQSLVRAGVMQESEHAYNCTASVDFEGFRPVIRTSPVPESIGTVASLIESMVESEILNKVISPAKNAHDGVDLLGEEAPLDDMF